MAFCCQWDVGSSGQRRARGLDSVSVRMPSSARIQSSGPQGVGARGRVTRGFGQFHPSSSTLRRNPLVLQNLRSGGFSFSRNERREEALGMNRSRGDSDLIISRISVVGKQSNVSQQQFSQSGDPIASNLKLEPSAAGRHAFLIFCHHQPQALKVLIVTALHCRSILLRLRCPEPSINARDYAPVLGSKLNVGPPKTWHSIKAKPDYLHLVQFTQHLQKMLRLNVVDG